MYLFSYERITDSFVRKVADKVSASESSVLIGPRYIGKRHILHLLRKQLDKQKFQPIVDIEFMGQSVLQTEKDAQELIKKAVLAAHPNGRMPAEMNGRITAPIKELADTHSPAILLASNIDAMAHHLARTFLEEVRMLVETGQLITVLSGENDFHELVFGPKSEFNVATQFVVQGYGEKEFNQNLNHLLEYFRLTLESHDASAKHLWNLTGGNLNILKILLWTISENRSDHNIPPATPLSLEDVPTAYMSRITEVYGSHIFRHARQLVDREPGCWNDLETLIDGGLIDLGIKNSPSHLELAGVAVRVNKAKPQLRFASPIMADFIKHTYGDRRFGDLHARINNWSTSFERYQKLPAADRIRPSSSDDRNEVEATVNALCAALYSAATQDTERRDVATTIEKIKDLFVKGCCYILGFNDITFWYRDTKEDTAWNYDPFNNREFTDAEITQIRKLLPLDPTLTPGVLPLKGEWGRYAVTAILPSASPDQQDAVIVGDFEKRPSISAERKKLIDRVLAHFVTSYCHALAVSVIENRSRMRGKLITIINDIFSAFRGHEITVEYLLIMAARGLRDLNYRRVLFCLVDKDRGLLQGILDNCDPPLESVADKINYDLKKPFESLQAFVVNTKEGVIIKDATQSQIADKTVVHAGQMKAFAIVPLLNPFSDVIGTLLVERAKNAVPSPEELKELRLFGQQLALAIEHCQRVTLLQSGLDGLADPILIVDPNYRLCYTNRPASDLLQMQDVGWQADDNDSLTLTPENSGEIFRIVRDSLTSGTRLASHIEGFGDNAEYHGSIIANVIKETFKEVRIREKTVGAFLRIQDLTYLYKILEASRHIAEAHDLSAALRNMLEAATELGTEKAKSLWGRLYLVRPTAKGDQEFVGKVFSGTMNKAYEQDFLQEKLVLAPRSQHGHKDWLCIEQCLPVVFCWKQGLKDGEIYITKHGLPAINWLKPQQPRQIRKRPGDFWMDFPLMTSPQNVLGKICLQCDESLQPENFDYLRVLSETFAKLLETYTNFDKEKRLISVDVAERTMSTLAHNVGTRLGSFSGILADYRDLEEEVEELKELNLDFQHNLDRTFQTVKQANALLAPVNPKVSIVDLADQIEKSLRSSLTSKGWTLDCKERPYQISIDSHLFETALLELVQNSRDHARDAKTMKIKVKVRSVKDNGRDMAEVIFSDNGPGVPPELSEQIFADFYSRRPGKKNGTGLGLGFVRRVTQAHGGSAICNREKKKGAEFIIRLPR